MGLCDMQSQMSISLVCKSYIIYFVELLLLPCCPFSWVDNPILSPLGSEKIICFCDLKTVSINFYQEEDQEVQASIF